MFCCKGKMNLKGRIMRARTILFFAFLFAVMPAWLSAEKMTGNWRLTGYTKYRDAVFVDRDRISQPAHDLTAAWIKIAPSGKSRYLRFVTEYMKSVQKWNPQFKSVEILCEINCSRDFIRFKEFVYLDKDRNVLHKAHETGTQWFLINPGSTWHFVKKESCAIQ